MTRKDAFISAALFATTFLLYVPTAHNGFIGYDDGVFVTDVPQLHSGFSLQSVWWAITSLQANYWQPLTWMSHMLDFALFGSWAGGHHLTSAAIHAANGVLLFVFLRIAAGRRWPAALAAVFFAWHPLRVESVAWVAERKGVLSSLMFLVCLLSYLWYARRPGPFRYAAVAMTYLLGLGAKPMLVTLPAVLLILDFWPLRRMRREQNSAADFNPMRYPPRGTWELLWEKVPLLILSGLASMLTFLAERYGGAIETTTSVRLYRRIGNAFVSLARYLWKSFVPINLSVYYPMPKHWPLWQIAASFVLVAIISWWAIVQRRRRPCLLVGWLWFLVMLAPVIGIIRVGTPAMADRYSYLPGIGLALIVACLCEEASRRSRRSAIATLVVSSVVLLGFGATTWRQIGFWRDDRSLFGHALAVSDDNWLAHVHVAVDLDKRGRFDEAFYHYVKAATLHPESGPLLYIGNYMLKKGNFDEAIRAYRGALELKPEYADAHHNLGVVLANEGKYPEAIQHFLETVRLKPDFAEGHCSLATALMKVGRYPAALAEYQRALQLDPGMERAQLGLVRCQAQMPNAPQTRPT